jgi:hypothetical protein
MTALSSFQEIPVFFEQALDPAHDIDAGLFRLADAMML